MPRWIDASPSQRWELYQKPADQKVLRESGAYQEELKAGIAKIWALRPGASAMESKRLRRRIRSEIKELRTYRSYVEDVKKRLETYG